MFTIFVVSIAIIFAFSYEKLLWFAVVAILIILIVIYANRFILVFKPSSIYQIHIKLFTAIRKYGTPSFSINDKIRNLPLESLDQTQMQQWTTTLQTSVIFNRICLFAASKLKNYQNSRLNIVSSVLIILFLIAITIVSFSSINYGLYKINRDFFTVVSMPTFFTFFYYSFNNLLFNSIREVVPSTPISQGVSMTESFFALFLIVIFVSLLLSVRSQRHTEELSIVTNEIYEQGKAMEQFIKDEYKFDSIEAAIAALERFKADSVNFIYQISKNI